MSAVESASASVASVLMTVALRSPRAGRPVRLGELRAPVLVARNSLVTIHLQSRWMRLTVQGRALEDGAIGQVIRVKNTKSNTVLHAEVAGPSVVAVSSGRPRTYFRTNST